MGITSKDGMGCDMTKNKIFKVPEVITCVNCGHHLVTKSYIGSSPTIDTPKENIHDNYDRNIPAYSILCTCGHFMRNIPTNNTWY